MEVGPIPFTSIATYYKLYGIKDFFELSEFVGLIRRLDQVLLSLRSEKEKKKSQGAKENGKSKPNSGNKNPDRHKGVKGTRRPRA